MREIPLTAWVTCDFPDQTRDKLLADLMPELKARIKEHIDYNANRCPDLFKRTIYHHAQVFGTKHTIDGEPVMVFLNTMLDEHGTAYVETICHIGTEKNVQARKAFWRNFMEEWGQTDVREINDEN